MALGRAGFMVVGPLQSVAQVPMLRRAPCLV